MIFLLKIINTRVLTVLGITVFASVSVLFYLHIGYQKQDNAIRSIKIELNNPTSWLAPIVYITDSTQVSTNFRETFFPHLVNDSVLLVDLDKETHLRQFRIYIQRPTESVEIKAIWLISNKGKYKLNLDEFKSENIQMDEQNANILSFAVLSSKGLSYLESPRFYYPRDLPWILIAIVVTALLTASLILLLSKSDLYSFIRSISLAEWGVFLFMFSIFLTQRFFNVTLVGSSLLLIRRFRIQNFVANKVNLFLISFYAIILLNFLFISPDYNFKAIEKYTVFLVLPVYASCIRSDKMEVFLCTITFIIGTSLLIGALVDISIYRNLEIVSFDHFTRTIHPVYYSYLIAFSILFIELNVFVKYKYIIQFILLLLLFLSGSKLMIFVVLLWFVFAVHKNIRLIVVPALILAFLFFTPINERFESIIKLSDLDVISQEHIKDPNDLRLNGLTLRVVLWQESLKSVKNFIFGNGVSLSGNEALRLNLVKRGLTGHLEYNAHNQYVTTIYKTGIFGFITLFAMLIYIIKWGVKTRNTTLIVFTLLMSFAMLSESIFERVSGIAFFCIVILILVNTELANRKEIIHRV